jgi:NTE family protein
MENLNHFNKVISIYSNTKGEGKTEYAINLAVALAKITKTQVLLIDMAEPFEDIANMLKLEGALKRDAVLKSNIEIDVLGLEHIVAEGFWKLKKEYPYIIINLPFDGDKSIIEIGPYSDTIHFFVDSVEENLRKAYIFLEDLLRGDFKFENIHAKVKIVVNRLNIFDKLSIEEIAWLLRRDIWAIVPEVGLLESPLDAEGVPIILKAENSPYAKAIFYIAKKEADKLLGLALGSGGAFGLAHIGVLRVLENNRIPIDILSGSSIGALIACMWGCGFTSDAIEHIAKKLRNKLNIMRLLDFSIPVSGILTGRRLKRFLRSILGEKTFEDFKIPVKIMVYDLANRETLIIEKGLLVEAIYMSISIPGIFKPKIGEDRMIVDGGISDPVPVDVLLKEGVKKIIAVNVMPGHEDIYERNMKLKKRLDEEENMLRNAPFYMRVGLKIRRFFRRIFTPNIFDVIITSMQAMEYMLAEDSCRKATIVLRPVFSDATSIDFHLVKNFIKRGEEETISHIEDIKQLAKE